MKNYIFLTNEGFTEDNSWNLLENSQVLWIVEAKNMEEAFENFKKEFEWVLESDYTEVFCYEIRLDTLKSFDI